MNLAESRKFPERKNLEEKIVPLKIWVILIISVALLIMLLIIASSDKKYNEEDNTLIISQTNSGQTEKIVVKNCNENIDCFITESEKCNPSKLIYKESVEILGIIVNTTTYYEMEESSDGKCELNLEIKNYEVNFSQEYKDNLVLQNMSEEEINSQIESANQYSQYFIGKKGKCKFINNSDLMDLLEKIKDGTLSMEVSCNFEENCEEKSDWDTADCEGDYFSN